MKKIINNIGNRISCNVWLYYILNFTWGFLTTIVGYLVLFIIMPAGKVRKFNHTLYLEFNKPKGWGFSIGTVFFVGRYPTASIKNHEFGHSVQNAIFGPFMIFFVYIPSALRFWIRNYLQMHGKDLKTKYDDVWFEGTASSIGLWRSINNK